MRNSNEISQQEIWNLFINNGNEDALSRIYSDNYDLLFDYGLRFTTNVHIVEDAIQDMFINLIKYRKNIGQLKNLQGYLVCAFRRQLFLDLNKQKKMISTEQMPEGFFDYFKSPDSDSNEKMEKEFLHATIEECVNNLTEKQKEIIYLKFEREIAYEEIAVILNISVESCYKSIYRSLKSIRCSAEKVILNKNEMVVGIYSDEIR
jgi:RNA polymerase sigma factor (sigma-70 family)